MKLKLLPSEVDRVHERRAQKNHLWSRSPRRFVVDISKENNSMANQKIAKAALAKAAALRSKTATTTSTKKTASAPATKKSNETKKTTIRKTDIPYAKVASMYDAGKSVSEISDSFGWTDKKSNWPYSYTYGILKRLRTGVTIDGKTIKVQPKSKK